MGEFATLGELPAFFYCMERLYNCHMKQYDYIWISQQECNLVNTLNDYGKQGYHVVKIDDMIGVPKWKTILLERETPQKQVLKG